MNNIELRGHIVICGWSDTARGLISQIRAENNASVRHIVLIAPDLDSSPVDDPYVYFVRGDPTEQATLEQAFVKTAETAIILADWSLNDPGLRDSRTALTTLAIKHHAPDLYTVAELMRSESRRHLERANVDEPICVTEMSQRLLVHAAMNHGLSKFFTEVLTYGEGSEIYKVPIPETLIDMSFRDAVRIISDKFEGILLAFERNTKIHCNPIGDCELEAGDNLFVMAEDYPNDLEQFGDPAAEAPVESSPE